MAVVGDLSVCGDSTMGGLSVVMGGGSVSFGGEDELVMATGSVTVNADLSVTGTTTTVSGAFAVLVTRLHSGWSLVVRMSCRCLEVLCRLSRI